MKDALLRYAPVWLQNAAISIYNWRQWRMRRSGVYRERRRLFEESATWTEDRWRTVQDSMLADFLAFATKHSPWFREAGARSRLQEFPPLAKQELIEQLDRIRTLSDAKGLVSYTGGTTGASMKVVYAIEDVQTRFAMLDWFRSLYGWELGKRTAWFSGKSLVRDKDLRRGIVWRDDWITRTRFFDTFHINEANFDAYWRGLVDFRPEYIVGFPSSLVEILSVAKARGLTYPHRVKAFFPTAETILPLHRELARDVLGCLTLDQYASSEGAPFIVECPAGKLHMMPLSGVFEVVDENLEPAQSGELLVTSFTTHGTPLIRYRIGDGVTMAAKGAKCACGWSFPLVESIDGRTADFVWSPQLGRINLGNLSNSTKGVAGIVAFKVVQNEPDAIHVRVHATPGFDAQNQQKFVDALRVRTGPDMKITLVSGGELPREKSGKFRIVENTLRHDQMLNAGEEPKG